MDLRYYDDINDQLYWQTGLTPSLFTGYTYSQISNTQIAPGKMALNLRDDKIWYASDDKVIELVSENNISTFGVPYVGAIKNVNLGNYGITASFVAVNGLSYSSERIVTVGATPGGRLYADITTDSEFIVNTTLISNLLNENSWLSGSYTSSETGAVESQKYQGPNYLYVYSNSTFERYPNEDYVDTTYLKLTGGTISGTLQVGTISNNSDIYFVMGATQTISITPSCWRDEFPGGTWVPAAALAAPDLENYTIFGVNTRKYAFNGTTTEELLSNTFEVPHDYTTGGLIEVHVHWRPSTTDTGTVSWHFDWNHSPVNSMPATQSGLSCSYYISSDKQYWHLITSFGFLPSTNTYTLGDLICFSIRRTPTNADDTYEADVILEQVALHVPVNMFGSRNIYSK